MTSQLIATLTMNPALDLSTSTDRVIPNHKLRCDNPRYDPGGGGINVARAVVRLGGSTVAIYPCGGRNGGLIESLLDAERVPQKIIPIEGWTRESVTVTEISTGTQFRFVLPGPEIPVAVQEQCLAAISALDPSPTFLVVSGSMPPGVGSDFTERLQELAEALQAKLVVDMSGDALGQIRGAYLMKPSLRELSGLVGRSLDTMQLQLEAALQVIAEGRAEMLVLSLGENGALLVTANAAVRYAAPSVPVQSTVGAGDSMLAAIVFSLAEGNDPVEAVRFGVAAGSAAVMRPGTELCHRDDVMALLDQVTVDSPPLSPGRRPSG